MNGNEQDLHALTRACKGNAEAMDFLGLWRSYVHRIDDMMDGDETNKQEWLGTFALAAILFSHPFYLRNLAALRQLVLNCTNAYADSFMWEQSPVEWQRGFADHYRHFGAEMVLAVAGICGGYEHMRSISPELRTVCWAEHHTAEGLPI